MNGFSPGDNSLNIFIFKLANVLWHIKIQLKLAEGEREPLQVSVWCYLTESKGSHTTQLSQVPRVERTTRPLECFPACLKAPPPSSEGILWLNSPERDGYVFQVVQIHDCLAYKSQFLTFHPGPVNSLWPGMKQYACGPRSPSRDKQNIPAKRGLDWVSVLHKEAEDDQVEPDLPRGVES